MLDHIANYFGEKFAFYFAWLIHYTSWVLIPSFFGVALWAAQMIKWVTDPDYKNTNYATATDSVLNPIYSIIIAIWTTLLVESWK